MDVTLFDQFGVPIAPVNPLPVQFVDAAGSPLGSLNGALDVHDADVHHRPLNLPVLRCTANTTNPAATITAGEYAFDVAVGDGVNFPVGKTITIAEEGNKETIVFTVTSQVGDSIELDMRVGLTYTTAAVITECIADIASAAGSMAAPQIYELGPPPGEVWHLVRFLISMVHAAAGDDSKFGDQASLTNGVVLRLVTGTGAIGNFTNWKNNGDMANDMYNVEHVQKAAAGAYATRGRGSVKIGSGAIIYLDGTAGDKVQVVVQDAGPAALTSMGVKFQGHKEGE